MSCLTPKWSRRFQRSMRSCCREARLISHVGRTGETKKTDHSDDEETHLAAPPIGVVCITAELVGANRHSRAAARGRVSIRSAASTRGTSRGEAKFSLAGLGVVKSCRRPARTSWHSRPAARQRRQPRRLGTVDTAGLFNACAIIRSGVSVTRVVGLVSNGVLRSPQ